MESEGGACWVADLFMPRKSIRLSSTLSLVPGVPTQMTAKNRRVDPEIEPDPYSEGAPAGIRKTFGLFGGRFRFESNNQELLSLLESAYAGLPAHRFSAGAKTFRIKLMVAPASATGRKPPPISMLHGPGFLGSATPSSTFVVLSPRERTGLVCVSAQMLRFPYHLRYEIIEFAVFTLACRAQGLVPLHAACVGLDGRAILLMGASGAGKSTLSLQCLTEGFEFLAEDSVFVAPRSMRATGAANFLHVRSDSTHWLGQSRIRSIILDSPVIQRRSGVKKFEVDLRRKEFRLAPAPVKVVGVAFLSARPAGSGPLLRPLSNSQTQARLKREQAYGHSLPQWHSFSQNLLRVRSVEMLRGAHPSAGVHALRQWLESDG
jgi:hypothetical protein